MNYLVTRCFLKPTSTSTRCLLLSTQIDSGSAQTESAHSKPVSRIYFLNQYSEPELSLTEALKCLRAYSISERPETVDVSLKCNMKMSKGKVLSPFRGTVIFPHSFGSDRKLLVFVEESKAHVATEYGADIVGGTELIANIEKNGVPECDSCLCTVAMLPQVKKVQKILRTKMPTEKRGTVVEEITKSVIDNFKRSREFRTDRSLINMAIGKLFFTDLQIEENLDHLLEAVLEYRGNLPKGTFIKSITLSSSHGPGFKVAKTFTKKQLGTVLS